MDQLDGHRGGVAQLVARRVEPFAQGVGIQGQQRGDIAVQIADDHGVFVFGMPGQRCDQAGITAQGAKHAGDMHQGVIAAMSIS